MCQGKYWACAVVCVLTSTDAAVAVQDASTRIVVGENIRVSSATLVHKPLVEPHVAANPNDARHFVAASMVVWNPEDPFQEIRCFAFSTFDGGETWSETDLSDLIDRRVYSRDFCGDVWVALDKRGTAYISALIDMRQEEPRTNNLIFRSSDGGRHWGEVAPIPLGRGGGFDQGDILVDITRSRFSGTVYFSAVHGYGLEDGTRVESISVSKSADSGRTFSDPVPAAVSNLSQNELNMVTLSDGTLIVSYQDFMTWQGDDIPAYRLDRRRLWIVRSRDGGETFSAPFMVAEAKFGQIPKIAADNQSAIFRDRLYAVWANWNGSDNRQDGVFFTRSSDRGKVWPKPITIDRSPRSDGSRGTAAIAVNKQGVVGVAWYDRRNDPENQCQDIYFTASLDGGNSFLEPRRVSTEVSCPASPDNGDAAGRWPMGGEYSGLAAAADGRFHVVWSDARSGVYQLFTAAVTVEGNVGLPSR